MGRHKHNHIPFEMKPVQLTKEHTVLEAKPEVPETIPATGTKVWVVKEESRAALNGALVTVYKGKVIKKWNIAKRLLEQNIPLEEKYI